MWQQRKVLKLPPPRQFASLSNMFASLSVFPTYHLDHQDKFHSQVIPAMCLSCVWWMFLAGPSSGYHSHWRYVSNYMQLFSMRTQTDTAAIKPYLENKQWFHCHCCGVFLIYNFLFIGIWHLTNFKVHTRINDACLASEHCILHLIHMCINAVPSSWEHWRKQILSTSHILHQAEQFVI